MEAKGVLHNHMNMSAKDRPVKGKPIRKRLETPMAKNLRDLLKERGVSVRAAAELAGVSS
jgi:hypothetical protein